MIEELKNKIREFGLTPEQYESCLADASAKINKTTDMDWQEIIEKYSLGIHYDTLRKATQTIFGGAFVSEYYKAKLATQPQDNADNYLQEIRAERQSIRIEKQKLFDERTELNRKLREQARAENDLHYLESLIKERSHMALPMHDQPILSSDNDMFICVSDFHFGETNDGTFGTYNAEIAASRLSAYLDAILDAQRTHGSENAYVGFLGDLINGEIHYTVQLENREMLVEQVQGAAELLSRFVYELSLHFKNVYVNGVAGNHSRTSFKDQVLRGNRLDNLIPWYMKAELQHITNVHFIDKQNCDSTIANVEIRGHQYIMVHGDWDSTSEAGVSKLVMMLGYKPTAIFMGHRHTCAFAEAAAGVQVIQSGCFAGSGGDYCVSKRIYGKPSQMIAILNDSGVKCCYPVCLEK